MAGEVNKATTNPTTLYRLDQLERKQESSFECVQEKLEELVVSVNALRTEQQVSKTASELGQANTLSRIEKLEGKLDDLQTRLTEQIVLSTTELATLKTSVSMTEKLAPGAAAGGTTAAVVVFAAELIMKLVGT